MDFSEILKKRRTIRLFEQKKVEKNKIISLLNAARMSSCAMNKQVIRYGVVTEKKLLKDIFDGTLWAAMVKPHRTPVWEKTSPCCFIVIHGPQENAASYVKFDVGAAVMSMELQAVELGLGCCWLGSFDKENVRKLLGIAEDRQVYAVVAVGYPAESPASIDIENGEDQSYFIAEDGRLTVPKFTVEALTDFFEV